MTRKLALVLSLAMVSPAAASPKKNVVELYELVSKSKVPKDAVVDTKNGFIEIPAHGKQAKETVGLWITDSGSYMLGMEEHGSISWELLSSDGKDDGELMDPPFPEVPLEDIVLDSASDADRKAMQYRTQVFIHFTYELPRKGTTIIGHPDLDQTFDGQPKAKEVAKHALPTRVEFDFDKKRGSFKLGKQAR